MNTCSLHKKVAFFPPFLGQIEDSFSVPGGKKWAHRGSTRHTLRDTAEGGVWFLSIFLFLFLFLFLYLSGRG